MPRPRKYPDAEKTIAAFFASVSDSYNHPGAGERSLDGHKPIKPCIQAILNWTPGEPFPENVGAKVPDLEITALPSDQGSLDDLNDYGDTLEPEDPSVLSGFFDLDKEIGGDAL